MKMITYVQSCQNYRNKQDWIRSTWKKNFEERDVQVYFSEGGHSKNKINGDLIELDIDDGYKLLYNKSRESFRKLLELEWDHVIKTDDDCVFNVSKVLGFSRRLTNYDYVTTEYPGGFSIFSRRSISMIVENLEYDDNWSNKRDGVTETWEGLWRYIKEDERDSVIPEDIFIQKYLMKHGDLKIKMRPKPTGYEFEDFFIHDPNHIERYFGLHNLRTEDEFFRTFHNLNS